MENILGAAADDKGLSGDDKSGYIYGAMNNMGAMKGNKETAKGKAMQTKHDSDTKKKKRKGGFPLKGKK